MVRVKCCKLFVGMKYSFIVQLWGGPMYCIFEIHICSLVLSKNQITMKQLHIKLMNRVQEKNKHYVYREHFMLLLCSVSTYMYFFFFLGLFIVSSILLIYCFKKAYLIFFLTTEIIWLFCTTEIWDHYKDIALVCFLNNFNALSVVCHDI